MTREQVKAELKELKSIRALHACGLHTNDEKGLEKKYDEMMEKMTKQEKVIFFQHIYLNQPYFKIGMLLHYSEEGIRKIFSKTIDKIANMFEIKRTNFDRITESEEALAKLIIDTVTKCQFNECEDCPLYEVDGCSRQEKVIEWLQKECEE